MDGYLDRGRYYELIAQPDTEEWLKARDYKVTATGIAAVAGEDRFQTSNEYLEQVCSPVRLTPNEDMLRGKAGETPALELYCQQTGSQIRRPSFCVPKDYPDTGATPDAIVLNADGSDSDRIVEVKCPRKFTGVIYTRYLYQMLYQMYVVGAKSCDYLQYVNGEIQVNRVEWDQVRWELFKPTLEDFLQQVKLRRGK